MAEPLPLGTRRYNHNGYVLVKVATGQGYHRNWVFEHRLVWILANGPLPDGWVVHHLNEVKDDNRAENLAAEPSNSDHMKHHIESNREHGKRIGKGGRGVPKSPEHRARIAAALRGKPKSPSHRLALSESQLKRYR